MTHSSVAQNELTFYIINCSFYWASVKDTALGSVLGTERYFALVKWSKVAQSCPTLCDPMGCSPPRLLCPWIFSGKSTGVECHCLLQGIFLTQGSNLGLLHCRQMLYQLSHWSPFNLVLSLVRSCIFHRCSVNTYKSIPLTKISTNKVVYYYIAIYFFL